jgi:hypothetical protein
VLPADADAARATADGNVMLLLLHLLHAWQHRHFAVELASSSAPNGYYFTCN